MDIAGGCEPDADVVLLHFLGTGRADPLDKRRVPGAGERRRARKCGRLDAALRRDPKPCRAVGSHHIRDAVVRLIAKAEGIRDTCIRLAAEKPDPHVKRQLFDEFIYCHAALRNVNELRLSLISAVKIGAAGCGADLRPCALHLIGCHRRKEIRLLFSPRCAAVRIVVRAGELLICPVRAKPLRKLCRRGQRLKLLKDRVTFDLIGEICILRVSYIFAEEEPVGPRLEHPCRPADLSRVVVGRKLRRRGRQRHGLRLPGFQHLRLGKCKEYPRGLSELSLRRASIELRDGAARNGASVLHLGLKLKAGIFVRCLFCVIRLIHVLLDRDRHRLHIKGRVGQAEAERITDLLLRARDRLKIPVADVDILRVIDVVV